MNPKNFVDRTGQKFGYLTVLKKVGTSKAGYAIWLCKCDCGLEKEVMSAHLVQKGVQSCGSCARYKGCKELSGTFWNHIKRGAKVRNLEFSITVEDAWNLLVKQDFKCALTGMELVLKRTNNRYNGTGTINNASLDRIDSSKGYTKDNIQWLDKDVNRMKWHFSEKRFIEICEQTVEWRIKRGKKGNSDRQSDSGRGTKKGRRKPTVV